MNLLSGFRKSLPLLALVSGAAFFVTLPDAWAEQDQNDSSEQSASSKGTQNYGVGGTSLRMRDIWGPAKMPPAPKDFGPHFDYPAAPLNGAPNKDPYPH